MTPAEREHLADRIAERVKRIVLLLVEDGVSFDRIRLDDYEQSASGYWTVSVDGVEVHRTTIQVSGVATIVHGQWQPDGLRAVGLTDIAAQAEERVRAAS